MYLITTAITPTKIVALIIVIIVIAAIGFFISRRSTGDQAPR